MNEVQNPPIVETPAAGIPGGEIPPSTGASTPNTQPEPKVYDITSMAGEVRPDAIKATMLGTPTEAGAYNQSQPNAAYGNANESGARQGNGQTQYDFYFGGGATRNNGAKSETAHDASSRLRTFQEEMRVGMAEAIRAGLGRLAVNPNMVRVGKTSEKSAEGKIAPTHYEVLDGLTNDLIANADLPPDDPQGLSSSQRYGIVRRLYETVKTLGGEQEIQRLDAFVVDKAAINTNNTAWGNERAWIKEAQRTVVSLLGGMPHELTSSDIVRKNIKRYYSYSPSNPNAEAPWNPKGTLYTAAGQKRSASLRSANMRRHYGLAS